VDVFVTFNRFEVRSKADAENAAMESVNSAVASLYSTVFCAFAE
jgi:hypothetical protein